MEVFFFKQMRNLFVSGRASPSGSHTDRPGSPGAQPAAGPHAQPHQTGEDPLQFPLSALCQQIQGTVQSVRRKMTDFKGD